VQPIQGEAQGQSHSQFGLLTKPHFKEKTTNPSASILKARVFLPAIAFVDRVQPGNNNEFGFVL
jgi:hypothetical protein